MLAPTPARSLLYPYGPEPRLHTAADNAQPATAWAGLLLGSRAAPAAARSPPPDNAPGPDSLELLKCLDELTPNRKLARAALADMIQSVRENSHRAPTDWVALIKTGSYGDATKSGARAMLQRVRGIVKASLKGPPSPALKFIARKLSFEVEDLRRAIGASEQPLALKSLIGKTRLPKGPKKRAQKPRAEEPLTSDPDSGSDEPSSDDELGIAGLGPLCPQQPRPGAAAPWPCTPEAFELPPALDSIVGLPRAPSPTLEAPVPFPADGLEVFGAAMRARGPATFFGDLPAAPDADHEEASEEDLEAAAQATERLSLGPLPMTAEEAALLRTSEGLLSAEPLNTTALELSPLRSAWLDVQYV